MITMYRCTKCGMAYQWMTLVRMCEESNHTDTTILNTFLETCLEEVDGKCLDSVEERREVAQHLARRIEHSAALPPKNHQR